MPSPHSFADFASARRFVSRQIAAWRCGFSPEAARLLADHPGLLRHRSLVLDLAFEEYCLRVERGGAIRPSEFSRQFPALRRSLERQLLLYEELGSVWGGSWGAGEVEWPEPGGRWLDFELLEVLGRGSTSRVYLARHAVWGSRTVVLKLTPRATREADVAGQLVHPRIVPVLSFHGDERTAWSGVCMPFLGRRTLENLLDLLDADGSSATRSARFFELAAESGGEESPVDVASSEGRFPGGERGAEVSWGAIVAWIGRELADALAWLHGRGLAHGDLKPANVLIAPDGSPRLLDFHLSTPLGSSPASIGGTLPYLAPELIAAAASRGPAPRVDVRADLFALGILLYELSTGHLPCEASAPRASATSGRCSADRSVECRGRLVERVGGELASIIGSCLESAVDRRAASAAELRRRLDAALLAFLPPTPRHRARRRWLAWIGAMGVIGCGGAWWCGPGAELPAPSVTPAAREPQAPRRDDVLEESLAEAWRAWRAGRWAEASEAFGAGIARDSSDPEGYLGRGLARRLLAQETDDRPMLRSAGEDFARCRDLGGPAYASAAFAEVLHAAHDEEGALRWYSDALRRGFDSAELRCNLAAIALNRGDAQTALAEAARALEFDSRLVAAQRIQARARVDVESPDSRVAELAAPPRLVSSTHRLDQRDRLDRLDPRQIVLTGLPNAQPLPWDLRAWPSDEEPAAPIDPLLIPYRDARSAHVSP